MTAQVLVPPPHAQQQQPPEQTMSFDPNRTIRLDQLEAMNLMVNPVWIFDFQARKKRWANRAGLELFNAKSLQELIDRDFSQMSQAIIKRNEELLRICGRGQHVADQWTFYPKGQAKTVRMTIGGIRLLDDIDQTSQSNELPHMCFFVEAVPVDQRDVDNEVLRGVEMVRHLPIAVCQFDLQGNCMFQNPEACLLEKCDNCQPEEKKKQPPTKTTAAASEDDTSDTTATTDHTSLVAEESSDDSLGFPKDPSHSDPCLFSEDLLSSSLANHKMSKSKSTGALFSRQKKGTNRDLKKGMPNATFSKTDTSQPTTKKPTTQTTTTTKQNKADGSLLHRFVDPDLGPKILKQVTAKNGNDNDNNNNSTLELEAMIHTQRGPTWAAIQIRQAKDPVTGQPVLLYSARDKTDAVQARKERQAREQKSEFMAIIAHEVRTPLHQITGFVDLLDQTAATLSQEQKSFVSVLKQATQGLMTVINDVLDFSKLEAGKLQLECIPYEPLSVVEGSLTAVRASCEDKNLYLRLQYDPKIPFRLLNDPNRLRQILLNLLSNSVKFTKQGGISVHAKYIPQAYDNVNNTNNTTDSSRVRFEVHDTGIGISQAHLDIIFQKYQQGDTSTARTYGGTGLGLTICHLLTQMMGGSMGVTSQVGQGTCFWFELPATEPPTISTSHDTNGHSPCNSVVPSTDELESFSGLKVLVVEDNKVNQKLVCKMLSRMGHTSEVAENGKIAIDMVKTHGDYQICLMDIQMPIMDGLEATRRLRSMGYRDLPIYGLTASVGRSDYMELGFDDWLPKPIRMKDLKLKLYQLQQELQGEQPEDGTQTRPKATQ